MGVAINNIYYLLYIYFIYIIFIPNINIYIPFGMGYLDQDLLQNIQIKLLKGLHFFFFIPAQFVSFVLLCEMLSKTSDCLSTNNFRWSILP